MTGGLASLYHCCMAGRPASNCPGLATQGRPPTVGTLLPFLTSLTFSLPAATFLSFPFPARPRRALRCGLRPRRPPSARPRRMRRQTARRRDMPRVRSPSPSRLLCPALALNQAAGVWPACLRIRSANCCFRQRFLRCCYSPPLLLPTGAGREIFLEEGFVAQDDLGASGGWQWGCLWLPV